MEKLSHKRIVHKWSSLTLDQEPSIQPASESARKTAAEKPVLLLGSNDPFFREFLENFLRDVGFQVVTALDGYAVSEAVMNHSPALIMLEQDLPGIDGEFLCRDLKVNKETRALPVVLIVPEKQMASGNWVDTQADVVIAKPFHKLAMLCEIRELLAINIDPTTFSPRDLREAIVLTLEQLPEGKCAKPELVYQLAVFLKIRNSFSLDFEFAQRLNAALDELKCQMVVTEFVQENALFLQLMNPYRKEIKDADHSAEIDEQQMPAKPLSSNQDVMKPHPQVYSREALLLANINRHFQGKGNLDNGVDYEKLRMVTTHPQTQASVMVYFTGVKNQLFLKTALPCVDASIDDILAFYTRPGTIGHFCLEERQGKRYFVIRKEIDLLMNAPESILWIIEQIVTEAIEVAGMISQKK